MVKVPKNLFIEKEDLYFFEEYCEKKYNSKRVLSKVMSEAMYEFIKNNP